MTTRQTTSPSPSPGSVVDEYRIQTNTTTQSTISTTTTTVVLEGEYNIPLEIRVSAINCAGSSAEVTEQVIVGMCLACEVWFSLSLCPCGFLIDIGSAVICDV